MSSVFKKPLFLLFYTIVIVVAGIFLINNKQNITQKPSISNTPSPTVVPTFSTNATPGKCLILEEKYCKQATFINDPSYPDGLLAAYKVPSNTVLFAPIDGDFSTPGYYYKNKTGGYLTYPGAAVTSYIDRKAQVVNLRYSFIYFKEKENVISSDKAKKADVISVVSDKNIEYFGNYNLIVRVSRSISQNETKLKNDPVLLKNLLGSKQ